MLEETLTPEARDKLRDYAKDNGVSFVFECVDMVHDPHVIDYHGNRLYLLDVIYNEIDMRKLSYKQTKALAEELGLTCKEKAFVIDSWPDFFDWYYEVTGDDYLYNGRHIEGFVVEDQNGYMVKLKLSYYHFWKHMRSVAHETLRKGYLNPKKTSSLTTALANHFYGWVKTLREETLAANTDPSLSAAEIIDCIPHDICTLRRWFFESDAGRIFSALSED